MESIIDKAGGTPPPNRMSGGGGGGALPGIGGGGGRVLTHEMLIPSTKCGLVIGKGGETIKQLQEKAGVKMVMIQDNNQTTGMPKPLRIIGEVDKVEVRIYILF
jgi:far upstream element-binding protein